MNARMPVPIDVIPGCFFVYFALIKWEPFFRTSGDSPRSVDSKERLRLYLNFKPNGPALSRTKASILPPSPDDDEPTAFHRPIVIRNTTYQVTNAPSTPADIDIFSEDDALPLAHLETEFPVKST